METNDIELTAEVVAAYVRNNPVPMTNLPGLIADVHRAIAGLSVANVPAAERPAQAPAVNPKKSVHEDFIICLEDGKKFKSLKKHIGTHYGLTPDEYRAKWGLDPSYPMVAPAYAATRSALAKKMGFGRKPAARKH